MSDDTPVKRRKRGAGRRPLLTPHVQAVIIEAISKGCPFPVAARHAGVDQDTLRIWRRKGERGLGLYRDFVAALEAAEVAWEVEAVASIHAAGEKDWRAHMALLERRLERWQRPRPGQNVNINALGDAPRFQIIIEGGPSGKDEVVNLGPVANPHGAEHQPIQIEDYKPDPDRKLH